MERLRAASGTLRTVRVPVLHLWLPTALPLYTLNHQGRFAESETRVEKESEVLLADNYNVSMYLLLGVRAENEKEFDFIASPNKEPLFLRFDSKSDIEIVADVLNEPPNGIAAVYYRASMTSRLGACPQLIESGRRLIPQGFGHALDYLVLGQTTHFSWVFPVNSDGRLWMNYWSQQHGISRHCLAQTPSYDA